jgi:transposase-like protein
LIGADRYERTDDRTNERNGHRWRLLTTKAGDVDLAIPKLRRWSFFPSIREPRRRIDQVLYAVVTEAYVHGVSTNEPSPTSRGLPFIRPTATISAPPPRVSTPAQCQTRTLVPTS